MAEHGGAEGIIDRGRLEAAVMTPRQTIFGAPAYPSLAHVAAAYVHGIATGHPFRDGNKRTAITVAAAFLEMNDVRVVFRFQPLWAWIVERVAAGKMTRHGVTRIFLLRFATSNRWIVEPEN